MSKPTTKACTGCGEVLPRSAFYERKPYGVTPKCKPCTRAEQKAYYDGVPMEVKRERWNARRNARNEHWRRNSTKYHYRREYGLTLEDVDAMKAAQGGRCLICQEEKDLHVDHDHETGVVRGMLCGPCNRGLGHLRDRVDYLRRAIDYLEGSHARLG